MLKSSKVEPDYIPILHDRVKTLCAQRGVKIGAVGQLIGKSPLFFNNVFKGKQNIYLEDIERVADTLSTTSDYLLGISDDPAPDGAIVQLSPEEEEVLELYRDISPEKRELFKKIIEQMKG